jgi:hypothetical protein
MNSSNQKQQDSKQPAPSSDKKSTDQIADKDLGKVSGGLNPQPLPPRRPPEI